ncbi:MAG: hypothetical protein ACK4MS_10555 [Paracoccaceae bacterium]
MATTVIWIAALSFLSGFCGALLIVATMSAAREVRALSLEQPGDDALTRPRVK